tara:strand:- start:773 stop:1582 length:810 start_codon:yes stop_codon:yes gene_type:complete
MYLFRSLSRSFTDCLHTASVSSVFSRIVPMQSTRDINTYIQRLQTMSKLGENLYEIKMQVTKSAFVLCGVCLHSINICSLDTKNARREKTQEGHLDLQRQMYENEAREVLQRQGRDEDLQVYFQRVREVRMQIKALQQSARTVSATINSIESQGNIEKIKRVLSYTIDTHKMAQESSMVDTASDHLLEGFEQISNTIEQEKTILDTLDSHINEIQQERPMDLSQLHDTEFAEWKAVLTAGKVSTPVVSVNSTKQARVVEVSAPALVQVP